MCSVVNAGHGFPHHRRSLTPLGRNSQHWLHWPSRKDGGFVTHPFSCKLPAQCIVFFILAGEHQSPLHNKVGTSGPFTLSLDGWVGRGAGTDFFPRGLQDSFDLLVNSRSHFARQVVLSSPVSRWRLRLNVTCPGPHSQQRLKSNERRFPP